jgi:hypothetical protein
MTSFLPKKANNHSFLCLQTFLLETTHIKYSEMIRKDVYYAEKYLSGDDYHI